MIAILLIVFTLGKGIAEWCSTYLMARIGQSAVLKLRQDLYNHLPRSPRLFRTPSHQLSRLASGDERGGH